MIKKETINNKNTLIISKNINSNIFYSYITPNNNYDCGFIFGLNNLDDPLFAKNNYFMLIIDKKGYLILSKFLSGTYWEISKNRRKEIYNGFDKRNTYKLTINYVPYIGKIAVSLNDNIVFDIFDNSLNGRYVGFESLGKGTIFTQIMAE